MIANKDIDRIMRRFSLYFFLIMTLLGTIQYWKGHRPAAYLLILFAVMFLLLGLSFPRVIKPVHDLFIRVGHVLGWINTRIILGLVFYLILTPFAIIMKLMGRDPLKRKFEPHSSSYWIKRVKESRGIDRYEKMY